MKLYKHLCFTFSYDDVSDGFRCHPKAHLTGLVGNHPEVCGELVNSWCVPGGLVVDDLENCFQSPDLFLRHPLSSDRNDFLSKIG